MVCMNRSVKKVRQVSPDHLNEVLDLVIKLLTIYSLMMHLL